jgi:hypothetical protein
VIGREMHEVALWFDFGEKERRNEKMSGGCHNEKEADAETSDQIS